MADIELVVKIDEEEYMLIKQKMQLDLGGVPSEAERIIANGTPLPKGHGDLVDRDALYDNTKLYYTEEDRTACVKWREINDAPTIIEADKEV